MAISVFAAGGGTRRIADIVYSCKAAKEYDRGEEQSWTATQKCWVSVSTATGAARGEGQYIRKNGEDVQPDAQAYTAYGYSYAAAAFEVEKGDVITARAYASDTGAYSYVAIQAFG